MGTGGAASAACGFQVASLSMFKSSSRLTRSATTNVTSVFLTAVLSRGGSAQAVLRFALVGLVTDPLRPSHSMTCIESTQHRP